MELTLKVRRGGPNPKPSYDSYTVEAEPTTTVFDVLTQVREEQDGSIAFRGNCATGFCGDCVMRANGRLTLMCMLKVERVVKDGSITIDPVPYAKTTHDVLVDNQTFLWDKYRAVEPWLKTNGGAPVAPHAGMHDTPERHEVATLAPAPTGGAQAAAERGEATTLGSPPNNILQPVDTSTEAQALGTATTGVTEPAMAEVRKLMRCTMCGLCDYGCTTIDVDLDFVGPAALTKAYRFLIDPRDTADRDRLSEAGEPKGMWDCVHCWEASEHCPYGIDPTHRIMEMRDLAVMKGVRSGKTNPQVARHTDSMITSVRESGWLDERRLATDSFGLIGSLRFASTGFKLWRRGKISLKRHKPRPGAHEITSIFEKANLK